MNTITPLGQQFVDTLERVDAHAKQRQEYLKPIEKVHIVGAGGTITAAYEQLRNAAEYTEEHLLLQRAIQRFFKRLFSTRDKARIANCGEELAVELTLAGYMANDHIPITVVQKIGGEAAVYFAAYEQYIGQLGSEKSDNWAVAPLAVQVESMLTDHTRRSAFVQFAYQFFIDSIVVDRVFKSGKPDNYDASVFIAVHRMLLKSDNATIRHALLERYQASPVNIAQYQQINQQLDVLIESDTVEKIGRIVNRRGAPLRILWRMVAEVPELPTILQNREKFLSAYESQIEAEYREMNTRINRGIVKSVVFLIITKFVIGIGLEVPYDYVVHGAIIWLPLLINLLFPPVYMILLRLTLVLPNRVNTTALVDRMDALLYAQRPTLSITSSESTVNNYSTAFNVLYAVLIVAVFGAAGWGLWLLGFGVLHLAIFFIFLSTASFLGFRLSRMVREIETVDAEQNGVSMIRDFLYLPFVVVGRWISEKYSKVNIIAMILDMVIELPLKTVIRLVQQWGKFISSKKDEL